jgi:predicted HD phosphohydrolase
MSGPVVDAATASAEQWAAVQAAEAGHRADERAALVRLLVTGHDEPGGYGVGQIEHARQVASRAVRDDADPDLIVAALLHDAAKPLTLVRHGEAMAEMLAGHVGPVAVEVVRRHGAYMADIVHGTRDADRWDEEEWHEQARRFARWDAASFDPSYRPLSLGGLLSAAGW